MVNNPLLKAQSTIFSIDSTMSGFTVPDEDLYEQGVFPSRFNNSHKWSFTIDKENSWNSKSINILDLLKSLNNYKIIKIELVDTNYDYSKKDVDQTMQDAEAIIEVIIKKLN